MRVPVAKDMLGVGFTGCALLKFCGLLYGKSNKRVAGGGNFKIPSRLFLNVVISGEPVEQLSKERFLSLVGQGMVDQLGRFEGVPEGMVNRIQGMIDNYEL